MECRSVSYTFLFLSKEKNGPTKILIVSNNSDRFVGINTQLLRCQIESFTTSPVYPDVVISPCGVTMPVYSYDGYRWGEMAIVIQSVLTTTTTTRPGRWNNNTGRSLSLLHQHKCLLPAGLSVVAS